MKIIKSSKQMAELSRSLHRRGASIGFVPTMGALHAGHFSLIERSLRENDRTVVSIFVNPLQFGPTEDFNRYPRPLEKDKRLCRKAGVDFLFHPQVGEMYPDGFCTKAEVGGLSELLEGKFRPGFFQGVATVVLKLLNTTAPDRAYFGEKDYQQLIIVRRMAQDLNLPVEIVGCPIIREPEGLALSSRNAYLNPVERRRALILHRAMALGASLGRDREGSIRQIRGTMIDLTCKMPGVRVDYIEIVDADTLRPAQKLKGRLRIVGAIRIGRTRLIDNVPLICKD